MSKELPERIGSYTIVRKLGSGGMGAVYLGVNEKSEHFAIKLPTFDDKTPDDIKKRFYREAQLAKHVTHKYVCEIHDIGEVGGQPFIAMQYIEGKPLNEFLEENDLSTKAICKLIVKIAAGLNAIHKAGIIHRDIKPQNIVILDDGSPVIVDFGLARSIGGDYSTLTVTGRFMGTPLYVAPEQIKDSKRADKYADVYSLGVILFQALTKQVPFHGDDLLSLVEKILTQPVPPPSRLNSSLDAKLDAICLKALAKDPLNRYLTVRAFADDIKRYLKGEEISARKPGRSKLFVAAGIAACLVLFVIWFSGSGRSKDESVAATPAAVPTSPRPTLEAPVKEEPSTDMNVEGLIDWPVEKFESAFTSNETDHESLRKSLQALSDTDPAAVCLFRCALALNQDLTDTPGSNPYYQPTMSFDGISFPASQGVPTMGRITTHEVMKLLNENGTETSRSILRGLALNEPPKDVEWPEEIPAAMTKIAANIVTASDRYPAEARLRIACSEHPDDFNKIWKSINVDEVELTLLDECLNELHRPKKTNSTGLGGFEEDFPLGMQSNSTSEAIATIRGRLIAMDSSEARKILFKELKRSPSLMQRGELGRYEEPNSIQQQIASHLYAQNDPELCSELVRYWGGLLSTGPSGLDVIPWSDITQFASAQLRRELVNGLWDRAQSQLTAIVLNGQTRNLPALKMLLTKQISKPVRQQVNEQLRDFSVQAAGLSLGWMSPKTSSSQPIRSFDNLIGIEAEYMDIQPASVVSLNTKELDFVLEQLNDDELIANLVPRMHSLPDERDLLIDIVASSTMFAARKSLVDQIARFADQDPDQLFTNVPMDQTVKQPPQNNPEFALDEIAYGELNEGGADPETVRSREVGWGDPWLVVSLKSPKRVTSRSGPKFVDRRLRKKVDQTPTRKSDPAEIQRAWFEVVRNSVSLWHQRLRTAISRRAVVSNEQDALQAFGLKLPDGVTLTQQGAWTAENSHEYLPDQHRVGFFEFESSFQVGNVKHRIEEMIASEFGPGDDFWTDSVSVKDGIELNIDVLYDEAAGRTRGVILILERPVTPVD